MKKQIRLNALDMMCMGCTPGIWQHPDDHPGGYNTLDYWTHLAQVLERGLFDAIFIADIYGVYDVFGGGPGAAYRHAVEFPVCDPLFTVPAMAMVTKHLGFGVTGTVTYEPPYSLARRLSTLDHLSGGRFAWNIVTGYLASAARAFGLKDQLSHDERYEFGEEYMDLLYKLREQSWEPGAVLRDKQSGTFADPEKIHRVSHKGRWFEMEGCHLCEPSPQRVPVLFQAGASTRGREFAAKHAECVFIVGLTREATAATVADLNKVWTLREVAEFLGVGGFAPIEVGSPEIIADAMGKWIDETGIDGFNLIHSVAPGDDTDVVDLVVPELQRRGRYRTAYPPGTFREKIYSEGQPWLRDDHPGAAYRKRPV